MEDNFMKSAREAIKRHSDPGAVAPLPGDKTEIRDPDLGYVQGNVYRGGKLVEVGEVKPWVSALRHCPGPEEFTGIAIPILDAGKVDLADIPGPEEFTGIQVLAFVPPMQKAQPSAVKPSLFDRFLMADVFVTIPIIKALIALGAAGTALLLWMQY